MTCRWYGGFLKKGTPKNRVSILKWTSINWMICGLPILGKLHVPIPLAKPWWRNKHIDWSIWFIIPGKGIIFQNIGKPSTGNSTFIPCLGLWALMIFVFSQHSVTSWLLALNVCIVLVGSTHPQTYDLYLHRICKMHIFKQYNCCNQPIIYPVPSTVQLKLTYLLFHPVLVVDSCVCCLYPDVRASTFHMCVCDWKLFQCQLFLHYMKTSIDHRFLLVASSSICLLVGVTHVVDNIRRHKNEPPSKTKNCKIHRAINNYPLVNVYTAMENHHV